jgi:hypothetical protein
MRGWLNCRPVSPGAANGESVVSIRRPMTLEAVVRREGL